MRRYILPCIVFGFSICGFCILSSDLWREWKNFRANRFQQVQGVIQESSKEYLGGGDYRLKLTYSYKVAGKNYLGDHVDYSHPTSWKKDEVEAVLVLRPAGALASVFYNPVNPADSILSPKDPSALLTGSGVLLWFALPAGFVLGSFAKRITRWGTKAEAGGLSVRRRNATTIAVYLPHAHKTTFTTLAIWLGLTVSGIIVPSAHLADWKVSALIVVAVTLSVALATLAWRAKRQLTGLDTLVIDLKNYQLTLPATFGRKRPAILDFAPIDSVRIEPREFHTDLGDLYFYKILVCHMQHDQVRENKIAMWYEQEERAEAFADWLLGYLNKEPAGRGK